LQDFSEQLFFMKFIPKFSFFFILFFIFALPCFAQLNSLTGKDITSINIDNISDEEIRAYFIKANESGLSEPEMYRLLKDKGMSQGEITKLEQRLAKLSVYPTKKETSLDLKTAKDDSPKNRNTTTDQEWKEIPSQQNYGDSKIFGSELFRTNSLVYEPNLRIATPSGYVLGPDDELVVNVFGYSEKVYNLTVNAEGAVYIQNVGPVYVSGLTIEAAGEKIKAKMASTVYKAIRSGQTQVQVSLGKIRSIRVTVIGAAKKPGTFTVSSLTTLFNVLYLCGGPSDMGSYRTIELIRGNEVKRIVDLYAFLMEGNKKNNMLLQEGDVIRIPYYQTRVSITGEVKREGKFEMLESEMFKDLLKFSGGLTDEAYRATISLTRITGTEKKQLDIDASQFNNFKPNGSDSFVVGKLLNRFENRIYVTGSVFRPGPFELTAGMTLHDVIKKAGGVKEDAYLGRINIFRSKQDLTAGMVALNLDSVLHNLNDISLIKNDSIVVRSIFDFKDDLSVEVKGQVKRAGKYEWRENMTLRDILLVAGGSTDFGDSATIEISRRIKNADVTKLNQEQTKVFTINLLNDLDPFKDILLQAFDVIIVKSLPGYVHQRTVLLQGEVMSPGQYTLQKSGDRLSDVFNRTGGFKASADSSSVTIRRNIQSGLSVVEREKIFQRVLNINYDSLLTNTKLKNDIYKTYDLISIDLRKALTEPASNENLILEDGDIITIQRNSNLVKVSGEVYYPTMVPFKEGASLSYYLGMAGNFTDNARQHKTVVIYPDGKVKSITKVLFFRHYPNVVAGAEIYTPQRLANNKNKISIGEMALIVSALAVIANVIIYAGK
jgi:protein involved in polysaccharide export with SLBB domain